MPQDGFAPADLKVSDRRGRSVGGVVGQRRTSKANRRPRRGGGRADGLTDPRLGVTVSVGLATAPVAEAGAGGVLDLAEFMAAADRALYRAKHDGRNRVDGTDVRRRPAPLSAS